MSFGAGRGRVSVESSFAARLVDTVLGGGVVFSHGAIDRPGRRGVLVGVLAPVFDRIGGSLQLGRSVPREAAEIEIWRRSCSVSRRWSASGWLRLTPPAGDLLPRYLMCSDAWRGRAGRLPVTGAVSRSRRPACPPARWQRPVGDAVVFDGVRAATFAASGSWDCRLRVGGHAADVTVDTAGRISIDGGFSPLQDEEGKMSASDSNTDATTVLAAASIEVVAELGRVSLRGDELLGLAPGAVLALGMGRTGVPCGSAARSGRRARLSTSTVSSASASRASRTVRPLSRGRALASARAARYAFARYCAAISVTDAAAADQRGALVISVLTSGVQTSPSARKVSARRTALSISNGVAVL